MHVFMFVSLAVIGAPSQATCDADCQIPALIAQMRASYDTTSWRAVDQLAQIGAPAIPALLEVLADRTLPSLKGVRHPARYQAAFALGHMRKVVKPAVPALVTVLSVIAPMTK